MNGNKIEMNGFRIGDKVNIIEAFRVFWNSNPTEEEFDKLLSGIVLFPTILYIMVKQ